MNRANSRPQVAAPARGPFRPQQEFSAYSIFRLLFYPPGAITVLLKQKPKRKRGRKRGGATDFVRRLLGKNPKLSTPKLRELAKAEFGYTVTLDRHFPQLVYRVRSELAG